MDNRNERTTEYLSERTRITERDGKRTLEIFDGCEWVAVFVPGVPVLPRGFSTVRSA